MQFCIPPKIHMESPRSHLLPRQPSPPESTSETRHKLSFIPLIFLIFFEVSGGPYGEEPIVGAAGPLLAILGFVIFPFIWSIPEALITAELATLFPGNGGFVIWADQAFGPFWGSLMGSWKFFTGVLNLGSATVLCIDYLKLLFPLLSAGLPRYVAFFILILMLSFLNYTGLAIVGYTAVTLGLISLSPFIVMTLIAIPKIDPSRWLSLGQKGVEKDWRLYFNTLFWNLNFWDNASTLAGEVENPQRNYPKALAFAGLLACTGYLVPLLVATGALPLNQQDWIDGYLANVAEILAGEWLKIWVEIGACLSVVGLYEAQLSSCAYQLLGMADLGFLPKLFGVRSSWFNTPWVGILLSTVIALAGSYMDFADIISSLNFLYCLGMLLEIASFIWLRRKLPHAKRPFRVPIGLPGLIIMSLVPCGFLVYIMAMATKIVYLVSAMFTLLGIMWYFFMNFCKSKKLVQFNNAEELGFQALEGE